MAASIWSLILPSIEQSSSMGNFAWVPATVGLVLGFSFLFLTDSLTPHLHFISNRQEGLTSKAKKTTMMVFAVTIHNIPEGMAVGVALAGAYFGGTTLPLASALALSIGIAIQNFPEGAIISMPLKAEGFSKPKSFLWGFISGAVEPIMGILAFFITGLISPILPYILAFAAGAMIYVVVEELIPDSQAGEHSNWATMGFALGFIVMMILDVAFS